MAIIWRKTINKGWCLGRNYRRLVRAPMLGSGVEGHKIGGKVSFLPLLSILTFCM
jgi:hypothetical protein